MQIKEFNKLLFDFDIKKDATINDFRIWIIIIKKKMIINISVR